MKATHRALLLLVAFLAAGCARMWTQPRAEPFSEAYTQALPQASRLPPARTVARDELARDAAFYSGMGAGGFVQEVPLPIAAADLARGGEVYRVFCAVCHGPAGEGDGVAVQRGFPAPPSFLEPRLEAQPPGYFFWAATNGFGRMFSYASRITPEDRWRVAAYIKRCLHGADPACPAEGGRVSHGTR